MLALFSRQCFFSSHQPYLTYLGRRVIFRTPSACCSVKVLICSSFVNKVCFLIPVIMQILQTVWLCCAAASPLGWKYLEATEPQNFVFLRNRCFPVGGGVPLSGFSCLTRMLLLTFWLHLSREHFIGNILIRQQCFLQKPTFQAESSFCFQRKHFKCRNPEAVRVSQEKKKGNTFTGTSNPAFHEG